MKQVAQNYKTGQLEVLEVPAPACRAGGVLVRSLYSLISTGTEVMKVTEAQLSLVGKARARPDQVRKVVDSVVQNGVRTAYAKAMGQLDSYTPLGYSVCGVVLDVGEGVEELAVGQLVACSGNEFALHAEVNWVPRNLCVPVPPGVEPRSAAFATVGAIAMQGVRRAELQLGETACVVGLGLVGQLTVQLLVAAGVTVVGLDVVPERCRLAEKAGALACDTPREGGLDRIERVVGDVTGSIGADVVLLTAGGPTNGPVEVAARLARDRARVVDVGKLELDLPWNAYYDKELELRFSRSYGPGRYDPSYELDGVDYPAGYVRWTERRNMQCFLDLLARGQLAMELCTSETFPLESAPEVYARLRSGALDGIGYLFEYTHPEPHEDPGAAAAPVERPPRPTSAAARPPGAGRLRVGFVGAGAYASSVLLPALRRRTDVELVTVVTTSSLGAANAQRRFGFTEASTDVSRLLADDQLDAVFVVTRHHSHAALVCQSLLAGKATFVEKPLALNGDELARIAGVVEETGNDRLMVGFNRRFAPLLQRLRTAFGAATEGAVVHYLVNAGPLAAKSWYRNAALEGSRFVGEGGHFLDTIGWWLGAAPLEAEARSARTRDDLHVTVRYDDGSVASIDYVSQGSPRYPKETFEVSAHGRTARFENFRRAAVWQGRRHRTLRAWGSPDKGQAGAIAAFLDAVRTGGPMPITLASLAATTSATLAVETSLGTGRAVTV